MRDGLVANNGAKTTTGRATRRSAGWVLGVLTTAAVAGCVVLFYWDPAEGGFLPPCVFHQLTGLHCPGCGVSRGLHRLLHGDVLGALRYNLFMVVWIPLVAYAVLAEPVRQLIGRQPPTTVLRPMWFWIFVVSVVLFAVLRNIPAYPFTLLAPPA